MGCIAFLLIFVPFFTWVSSRVGFNSDNASALLIAKDIASGNLRAENWIFSTQSYLFSDNIWTAIVIAVFGYAPVIIHVMPALYLAIAALFAVLLVARERPWNVAWLAPLILLPNEFAAVRAFELALHGGAYALAAASIYLCGRVSDRRLVPVFAALAVAWGVLANSDELFLVIFMLPAFLAALLHVVLAPGRRTVSLLAATLGGFAVYALAGLLFPHVFLYVTPGVGHQGLADLEAFTKNLGLLAEGVLQFFNIGFGRGALDAILSILRLVFFLSVLAGFAVAAVRAWRKSFVDTVLLLSASATVSAFVFSTMPVDLGSTRYLFFAVLAAAVFAARNVSLGRLAAPVSVMLVLLALTNLQSLWLFGPRDAPYRDLARYLRDNGLTEGYAGFWRSHVTSVTGDVHIAPVLTGGMIHPFYWLTKTTWYGPGRTFFMTPDPAEKALALAQFGPPRRTLRHGDMDILVWDEIAMPMMGFSLADGYLGTVQFGPIKRYGDGFGPATRKETLFEEVAMSLAAGRYRLTMEGRKNAGTAEIVIDAPGGPIVRQQVASVDGRIADFEFTLPAMTRDLRVRLKVRKADDLVVRAYRVYRVGD